jgi:hypothetical protein
MATYEQGRDQEYLDQLDGAISTFISRYNANPSATNRRTLFLFPGGMGSQLDRASSLYTSPPPFSYNVAWLDCGIVFGNLTNLQMNGTVDYQQRYVVPDGCIEFVTLRPYDGFIQWCQNNWLDLFVFGWDWRRNIRETVRFFLDRFLPAFDARVTGQCTPHPLDDFTLVGHSFGGMVVKLILNEESNAYVQRMARAITAASPFYGYGANVHRYFKGDPDLNWTLGSGGAAKVTEVVSTLASTYQLQFLDEATYNANQTALANDPEGYKLMSYPSMDAATVSLRADPYNPVPGQPGPGATGNVRYISNHKFDWSLLASALGVYQSVASPLTATTAAKFYNIRGVQFKNGAVLNDTVVSQTWRLVPPTFDPDADPDPFTDALGPGDGTQPAWTTRLLGLPDGHVITVKGDIEHMTLMNESRVQAKIAVLLGLPTKKVKHMRTRKMPATSRTELNKFVARARAAIEKEESPEKRTEIIRKVLRQYTPDQLHALLGRAYLDALRSPSQKTDKPVSTTRAPARRKRTGTSKSKRP